MQFSVQKVISKKPLSPLRSLVNVLILVVAVPVIIIAAISLSLYFLFIWLRDRLITTETITSEQDQYHFEIDLVRNDYIHILLVEDELDDELTALNEEWRSSVYDEETYLYRAKTIPEVHGLHGTICCFYCKEQQDGLILQILHEGNTALALATRLVFLDHKNLGIHAIDEIGAFFLYNDDSQAQLIKGFNKKEEIQIRLQPMAGAAI